MDSPHASPEENATTLGPHTDSRKTFYEIFRNHLKVHELVLSALAGLTFSLVQIGALGWLGLNPLGDHSWMVGAMIGMCSLLVFKATARLREFTSSLDVLVNDTIKMKYSQRLGTLLANFPLVMSGIIFGAMNTILGYCFGLWYDNLWFVAVILCEYFCVGFVCGLAVRGIYGVLYLTIKVGHEEDLDFDYLHPDKCGGSFVIGKVLFYFAIYTLIMGCFIAIYIYVSPWRYGSNTTVRTLIIAWMAFPFVCSIAVFLLPVLRVHALLSAYRSKTLSGLREEAKKLYSTLDRVDLAQSQENNQIANIVALLDRLEAREQLVLRMNTWPYDFQYSTAYLIALVSPLIALLWEKGLWSWITE